MPNKEMMRRTFELMEEAVIHNNRPFAALLYNERTGEILGETTNRSTQENDPTAHAELSLIRDYCKAHPGEKLTDYTLYSSCEPCAMCACSMVYSRVGELVYGMTLEDAVELFGPNITLTCSDVFDSAFTDIKVTGEFLRDEAKQKAAQLLKDYDIITHKATK
jgi:tRNA(Arg) A34 adenosine deaminase TadA